MNSAPRFGNGAGDLFRVIAARLYDPERDPFGRARTDSGHLSQLRNKIPQRGWIFRFSHTASPARTPTLLISAASALRPDSARAAQGGGDTIAAARLLP